MSGQGADVAHGQFDETNPKAPMTGTVHDRAISAELRSLATVHDPTLDSVGEPISTFGLVLQSVAQTLRRRADQLERHAPPATIDADYTGGEPPVGTVLTWTEDELDEDPAHHVATRWGYSGSEEDGYRWMESGWEYTRTWDEIRANGKLTVLRWGVDQ